MDHVGAVLLGLFAMVGGDEPAAEPPGLWVAVTAGVVSYQLPAAEPVSESVAAFRIMQRQVSQAEYAACVRDGGCAALDKPWDETRDGGRPVIGLSWLDANAYAVWYSASSGVTYRLPRYAEWLHAVGDGYVVDAPLADDPNNPARRWLAEYEREAQRAAPSPRLRRFAKQGHSASGALSVADNVWEWTDTCFAGVAMDGFCGIRIAAGRHPSALSDFIRDPIAGACSVGTPPTHVGLRLVRD